MSDRNDLPQPSAPNFNQRLRETVQTYLGRQGDPLDRGLTLRDLIENGIVKFKQGFGASSSGGGLALPLAPVVPAYEIDLTPPPQPTGFTVSAAISHVFIEHDPALYRQGNGHLQTRVFGAIVETGDPLPTFADAVEVGQFSGQVWAMPSNPGTTWRLWTKWETNDGVLSPTPAGGANGLEAITGQDVDAMVTAMTGAGKPFTVLPTAQVIDGVTYPAGIYSTNAFIMDLQVTRAKIANLAVDSGKIANLSADKLTAGSIAVGQHIQSTGYVACSSGWRINGNGSAEFGAASIRDQLVASQIDSRGLSIRDAAGNVILSAGSTAASSTFLGNVTGSIAGVEAGNLVGTASAALATASSANSTADAANATADAALGGLSTKLSSNARNVLAGLGGLSAGTLNWNASGVRTGGYGVGFTQNGIAAYNSAGKATFVIDGTSGDATFAGSLAAASGTFAGNIIAGGTVGGSNVGSTHVRSANYAAGSAGWSIESGGNAEFNQLTVRSGQVTGALLKITAVPRFFSGLYYEMSSGVPISTVNGPYYFSNGAALYLVWTGSILAPETAAHRIASVITVNASNGRADGADLVTYVVINATLSDNNIVGGEHIGNSDMSSQYGLSTTTSGTTSSTYSGAVSAYIFVSAYNCQSTITTVSGLFWGVR